MAKRLSENTGHQSARAMWDEAVATAAAMVRTPHSALACPTLEIAKTRFDELKDAEEWVEVLLPNEGKPRFNVDSAVVCSTRPGAKVVQSEERPLDDDQEPTTPIFG